LVAIIDLLPLLLVQSTNGRSKKCNYKHVEYVFFPVSMMKAVDLAKRFCDGRAPRIINGCLRTFVKHRSEKESVADLYADDSRKKEIPECETMQQADSRKEGITESETMQQT
jgi:hypothetical protein